MPTVLTAAPLPLPRSAVRHDARLQPGRHSGAGGQPAHLREADGPAPSVTRRPLLGRRPWLPAFQLASKLPSRAAGRLWLLKSRWAPQLTLPPHPPLWAAAGQYAQWWGGGAAVQLEGLVSVCPRPPALPAVHRRGAHAQHLGDVLGFSKSLAPAVSLPLCSHGGRRPGVRAPPSTLPQPAMGTRAHGQRRVPF